MERYDPAHVELVGLYEPEPGDVGMHFLCAPDRHPGARLHPRRDHHRDGRRSSPTRRPARVVVEPDVTNTAVHALNEAVGFARRARDHQAGEGRPAELLHPRAVPRPPTQPAQRRADDHRPPPPRRRRPPHPRALGAAPTGCWSARPSPSSPTSGCSPRRRRRRRPLRRPQRRRRDPSTASPPAAAPSTTGRSTPTRSPGTGDGAELPLDALDFFIELRSTLGLSDGDPAGLPGGDLLHPGRHRATSSPSRTITAAELATRRLPGHRDRHDRGPPLLRRQQRPARLRRRTSTSRTPPRPRARSGWSGWPRTATAPPSRPARASTTTRSCASELGAETLERFAGDHAPSWASTSADYLLIPVHPWQWWNKLTVTFAAEVAQRHLVCLGEGDDEYLAQQSIRTFFNTVPPRRSTTSRRPCPSSTWASCAGCRPRTWRRPRRSTTGWPSSSTRDPVLQSTGPVDHPRAGRRRLPPPGSTRPPPTGTRRTARCSPRCGARARSRPWPDGERLATMASLLHVDREGASFAGALIEQSGLTPADVAAPLPATPTSPRCCTASTPTTWCSCRTARTSSSSSKDGVRRSARSSRTSPRRSPSWTRTRCCRPTVERHPRRRPRGQEAPVDLHRRLRLLLPLPRRRTWPPRASWTRTTFWRTVADVRPRLPGVACPQLADRFAQYDMFARRVRAVLPQPAAAAQQPADGRPGGPGGRPPADRTLRNPIAGY